MNNQISSRQSCTPMC